MPKFRRVHVKKYFEPSVTAGIRGAWKGDYDGFFHGFYEGHELVDGKIAPRPMAIIESVDSGDIAVVPAEEIRFIYNPSTSREY